MVLQRRERWQTSASTVGRILRRLIARGVLREPPRHGVTSPKRPFNRPYAVRKPKEYAVRYPGDILQVDTLDVRPLPGVVLKHFTVRDMYGLTLGRGPGLSKRHGPHCHRLPGPTAGPHPFPVRAIQVDGGSEFQAGFEQACAERGSGSLSCRLALRNSTGMWSGLNAPTRRSSIQAWPHPPNCLICIEPVQSIDSFRVSMVE